MKLPRSVRLSESEYPFFEIDHPTCRAKVALHGGQVVSWRPDGEEEVLYLSPDAVFQEGKAIRGGIPVCWPWFNAHPTSPELPSHGIARSRFWEVVEVSEEEDGVTIRMCMSDGSWKAETVIRVGNTLKVSLISTNPGREALRIAGALHAYFRVGDVSEVRVEGLDGAEFLDTVGGRTRRNQVGDIKIEGETDSIYDSRETVRIVDASLQRTIRIEKQGSPSTVVWNPWKERAKALSDLPDEAYRNFVCAETAIANSKAIDLQPGEQHTLSMVIGVER